MFRVWVLAVVLSLAAPMAMSASFSCDKARSAVEKSICASTEVSNLDEYLGRYYAAARIELAHAESCVVADQRTWLRSVRDGCKDAACLKRVYLERLAELDALQPGVTRLRNIDLPRRPPLVWVVPPAADQVAAPRGRPSVPLAVQGKIVNDIANGDGFVLQSGHGTRYLVVGLMFLEQPTVDALAGLARLPDARFDVRGRADLGGGEPQAFSASHCTFIYRTVP